jgi:hypothetical protein
VTCAVVFVTVNVVDALALPYEPVQVSVYLCVPGATLVKFSVPLVACASNHAPLAVHELTLLELHVSVAISPAATDTGLNEAATEGVGCTGGGVVALPPPPQALNTRQRTTGSKIIRRARMKSALVRD